jgi:hypothetical protein
LNAQSVASSAVQGRSLVIALSPKEWQGFPRAGESFRGKGITRAGGAARVLAVERDRPEVAAVGGDVTRIVLVAACSERASVLARWRRVS